MLLKIDYTHVLEQYRVEVSERIREIPEEKYPRVGYGFHLPKEFDEEFDAVVRTRDMILAGSTITDTPTHIKDLSLVGKIFNRAQAACFRDWFLQSFRLGHPSHLLARAAVEEIAKLQVSVARKNKAAISERLSFLDREAVVEMLDNYIGLTRNEIPPVEKGWAYLAWRSEKKHGFFPGASSGPMYDILEGLATRNPWREPGFGVVAAWLVHDPEFAAGTIDDLFAGHPRKRGGFRMDLGEMSDAIEGALLASDNLVVSPWHSDDDEALERLGLRAPMKDTSQDDIEDDAPAAAFGR
ncbi:hypothetical protein G6L37_06940 [Agrobacterium rubi]|nr:hypothetical protein [Agrobacterium rubi]NTF25101.1 hypothetical protein [Agrobacterium rubi]